MPLTGELSNQIAEGIRKIFELETLIKRESPRSSKKAIISALKEPSDPNRAPL